MEKPSVCFGGYKRCILHVCQTVKARFDPLQRDEAGQEDFFSLGKKTHDAFQTKGPKNESRCPSNCCTNEHFHNI